MSLDPENTDPGYRIGRLFAVLERIQQKAHPNLNATIKDRFWGAVSTRPASVLPRLMRLSQHHLDKIEAPGTARALEREIQAILAPLDAFPALMRLPAQGQFALGYYHQREHGRRKAREHRERREAESAA